MGFVIPERIQESILTGGPWAGMFLLAVLLGTGLFVVMMKAVREADKRVCATREMCDKDIHAVNEERIKELRIKLEAEKELAEALKDLGRSVESRANAITQNAEATTKMAGIIEINQRIMIAMGERIQKDVRFVLEDLLKSGRVPGSGGGEERA